MKTSVFTLLFFSLLTVNALCQTETDPRLFPGGGDSLKTIPAGKTDKIKSIDVDYNSGKQGDIKVVKDSRIQELTKFVGTPQKGSAAVQLKGYRVQLFFDADKDQVNQKRADYLSRHSENPAYVDYLQPNFRLRVGNFRTKLQAQQWQDEIKGDFPDAIVVEDWIDLPQLKTESK